MGFIVLKEAVIPILAYIYSSSKTTSRLNYQYVHYCKKVVTEGFANVITKTKTNIYFSLSEKKNPSPVLVKENTFVFTITKLKDLFF